MIMRAASLMMLGWGLVNMAMGDVVQLKDKASITGRIIAEKPDQIFVDVGYTVLSVPRIHVDAITKTDNISPSPAPVAAAKRIRKDLYYSSPVMPPERTVRELASQIGESVVQVRTPGGLGSGFFINDEGYLITNFHVIEGEAQISIEVYQKLSGQLERKNFKEVRIIALNKFADLALLKVEDKDAPKFAFVPLGSSDTLAVGERVFAIGSPLGLERTVTEGILSTKTRELEGALYLQTSAPINPGNSGGPLFNLRGEVVGVTNMKATSGEGLGFAIPAETVVYFLTHRDAYAYDNDNPRNAYRYLEPPRRLSANPLPAKDYQEK